MKAKRRFSESSKGAGFDSLTAMTRALRVVDFQVSARRAGLVGDEHRIVNEALFSTYEPVRLWLKEREVRGPFRALVVSLADEAAARRWHGLVSNAAGICEVTEAIAVPVMKDNASDHRWVMGLVKHALGGVALMLGWRSEELEDFVESLSASPLPLVHVFDGLARVDDSTGLRCVPWLSVKPGETQVGVRIGDRDVPLVSKPGPLYLEDGFPIAKAAILGRDYALLDKGGRVLASVAIGAPVLH